MLYRLTFDTLNWIIQRKKSGSKRWVAIQWFHPNRPDLALRSLIALLMVEGVYTGNAVQIAQSLHTAQDLAVKRLERMLLTQQNDNPNC